MRRLGLAVLLAACTPKQAPPPPAKAVTSYDDCKAALDAEHLEVAERCFVAWEKAPDSASSDPARRANALFALADIRLSRGDGKGAIAYAMRAVALRPEDEEAQELLVQVARDAGDHAAERAALVNLVKLDPDALDARLRLAGLVTGLEGPEAGKALFLEYEDARIRILQVLGKDPSPANRKAAARRLAAAKDAGTARALVLAMTDRDAGVRAEAVHAVAQVGIDVDAEIRPALVRLDGLEKDPGVKAELAEALAKKP